MMRWTSAGVQAVSRRSSRPAAAEAELDRKAVGGMASSAGDADVLAQLYDRHSGPVYSLALRVLGDTHEAEEVVQDVFAEAWRRIAHDDAGPAPVNTWLLMLTRRRAIDRLRLRRSLPPLARDGATGSAALEDSSGGLEMVALTAERTTRLRAALDRLPLLQRTTIELAFFGGLTPAEIADCLEEPLDTVQARIRVGLLQLRGVVTHTMP